MPALHRETLFSPQSWKKTVCQHATTHWNLVILTLDARGESADKWPRYLLKPGCEPLYEQVSGLRRLINVSDHLIKKWPVSSESGKLWINCIYETVRGSEDLKSTVISLLSREESKRGLCTNLKIKMNAFVYMVEFKWKNVTMVFRILLLILMYYYTK